MYDALVTGKMMIIPKGVTLVLAKVIDHKHDMDGNPIGTSHSNSILDSWIYQVQFLDGHIEDFAANIIFGKHL